MSAIRSILGIRSASRLLNKRCFSQKPTPSQPKYPSGDSQAKTDVPGLSSYVIKQKTEPHGPGASATGKYKVPEYFCYDRFSYHGAEVEMAKYRCPQPSAIKGKN